MHPDPPPPPMSQRLNSADSVSEEVGTPAPKRIRLSRAKGWKMPPNTVKVDRSTKWGNPFPIGKEGPYDRVAPDAEGAVGFFRAMLRDPELRAAAAYPDSLEALRGRDLACWCAGPWCHADVLLELANA